MSTANQINPLSNGRPVMPSERPAVRAWRVGSLSMGITLMLIGTAFAVSLWQDAEAYEMLLWVAPVVFILLGAEVLIYLVVAGKRDTVVQYDWLSVFFVGIMGMASLSLALMMYSGIFDELKRELQMTSRTAFVETEKLVVPAEVNKIIIQSSPNVTIDETKTKEIQLMGQIRYRSPEPIPGLGSGLMKTNIIGSDLYVFVVSPDLKSGGWFADYADPRLILALPEGIEVERRMN